MSKFTSRGTEPYDGRCLTRWLTDTYRPTLLPQSDAIWHAYELPSGRTVVIPGPSAAKRPIATGTARKIATDLGMSHEELRVALGHPIIRHSKPSRKTVAAPRVGCSKSDVVAQAKAVHRSLNGLEVAIRQGDRDSAFYMRLHERLTSALVETQAAITQATTTGVLNAR